MFELEKPTITLALLPFCSTESPPVGLAILTGILRQRGYEVTVLDLNLETRERAPGELRYLWSGQQMVELIEPGPFNTLHRRAKALVDYCTERLLATKTHAIGLSLFTTNVRFSTAVAWNIRHRDPRQIIIMGGPSCKVVGERQWVGPDLADAWVCGDGEEALIAILEGKEEEAPDGVYLGQSLDPAFTMEHAVAPDLEAYPFPDYDELHPARYDRRSHRDEPVLPIVASRGCIMSCAFCNERSLERRYRTRSADHIFAELKHLHQRYGPVAFHFNDQLINGNLKVLGRLAELIIEDGLDIRWLGQAIARGDMTPNLLARLHQAGLEQICFGIESGSPSVMARMGKNVKLLDPEIAIKRTHDARIQAHINLMTGFPGETEEEFQETLDLLERCKHHIDMVDNIHPFFITPRSPIDQAPREYGILFSGGHLNRAMKWVGEDGNNYARRKERVRRLAAHLDELGIRYDPERLPLYDEKHSRSHRDAATSPAEEKPALWLTDLLVMDDEDQVLARPRPGDTLWIKGRYFVDGEVEDPCFRMQIFTKDPGSGQNVFVYGTNTARCKLKAGKLEQGPGEVGIRLGALPLSPGRYVVTFGVWPEENAEQPYDVRHGGTWFTVEGDESEPSDGLSLPWGRWSVDGEEDYLAQAAQPGPWGDAPLYMVDNKQGWTDWVVSCVPLTVVLRCPARLPEAAVVEGRVLHGETVVTCTRRRLPDGIQGEALLQWRIDEVPLLAGQYEVRVRLLDGDSEEVVLVEGHGLKVTSQDAMGAGAIYLKARWVLS